MIDERSPWEDITLVGDKYRREINLDTGEERGGDKPRFDGDIPLNYNIIYTGKP